MFENINLEDFWDDDEYSIDAYVSEDVTEEVIQSIEKELGYKLPKSYIYLMKKHNGEPKVVHIDQEWDYAITVIAENFEEFVSKLCSPEVFK